MAYTVVALALVLGASAAIVPTAEAIGGKCNGEVDANCTYKWHDGTDEKCGTWAIGKCIVG